MPLDRELHLALARIVVDVARQLGHGRCDADLVLLVEGQQAGQLPGALAGGHDVLLLADAHGEKPEAHGRGSRATTTVMSSRCRL